MNYKGKKIAITGADGFIGKALNRALIINNLHNGITQGNYYDDNILILSGDIRDPKTFEVLDHKFDYLFHFASPSSQTLFKRNPSYCIETTIKGAINAADACAKHGIRFIYPSTGLLSSGRYNEYAMCKKIIEDYVNGLNIDSLGLRIFATYGPGEGHKADYASVPYLFARDIVQGKKPTVFGGGEQVRDFIYIEDVIQAILVLAEECTEKIIDVGTGVADSFNDVLKAIRKAIGVEEVTAKHVNKPANYVDNTLANVNDLHKYYIPQFDLAKGIKLMVESIQENERGKQ